jgi:TetR/AcrR family transcriptional repressor of mexJK operon
MGAIEKSDPRRNRRHGAEPRADDPRVVRTRAAVFEAARKLFLEHGYSGTTMEQIAAAAGLTKRTLYNNYGDKHALFTQIIADVLAYVERFARGLDAELTVEAVSPNVRQALEAVGERLALAILRPEVIALRRLVIAESRTFPGLAAEYFDRAPAHVLRSLTSAFAGLSRHGLLRVADPARAAAQFAYLIAGEFLDRAIMIEDLPSQGQVVACAREGVQTFWARYGEGIPAVRGAPSPGASPRTPRARRPSSSSA